MASICLCCLSSHFQFFFCNCRLVTPATKLNFKLMNKNTLRADTVLGQSTVDLTSELRKTGGKCKYFIIIIIIIIMYLYLFC